MSLVFAIDTAARIVGSQNKLAALLGMPGPNLSEIRKGKRACPLSIRAQIAQIAGHDTKRAIFEGLAAKLDPEDPWEAEALATLQAIIDAFPEAGEEAKSPTEIAQGGATVSRRKRWLTPALVIPGIRTAAARAAAMLTPQRLANGL